MRSVSVLYKVGLLFRTEVQNGPYPSLSGVDVCIVTCLRYNEKVCVKVNITTNSSDRVVCLKSSHLFPCSVCFKRGLPSPLSRLSLYLSCLSLAFT